MTIASPTYTSPVRRRVESTALDYELVDAAIELFDSGSFLESMQKIFQHLLPNGAAVDLTREPGSFTQGSSRVTARVEDNLFSVSVPVVRLPTGGGAVAALRYVLQRINGSGQLFQARLHGDDILLEYKEKLAALHPQKLLEVLRRMPVVADQHDDWMISQFGAIELDRAPIQPVDDEEYARAEQIWHAHWHDVEELLKEAQRKRSQWFLNEVTSFALCRIRFELPLCGSLLPRLLESAGTFNDSDTDPMKRETTLAKCIKEMKAVTSDELRKNLGHAEFAISPLADGTPGRLTSFFGPGNYMESIEKYRVSGQSIEAGLALVGTYYYLLATHSWPTEVDDGLKAGLLLVSGKPWRDAANLLIAHARELVEQFGGDDDEDEDDEDEEGEKSDEEASQ